MTDVLSLYQQLQRDRRLPTAGMTEEVWAELRYFSIGGSDAGAACGLSKWKDRAQLVGEKQRRILPEPGNQSTSWGHIMEPVGAKVFSEQTGFPVQNHNFIEMHPEHDFMTANLDRRIVGLSDRQRDWLSELFGVEVKGPGNLQIKNTRFADGWGKPDNRKQLDGLCTSGEIPEDYYLQCQHEMACAGLSWGFLAVSIQGSDLRWYPYLRDDALIGDIVAMEQECWQHVVAGTLPPLDFEHPRAVELLQRLYPGSDGSVRQLSAYTEQLASTYITLGDRVSKLQGARDVVKAMLMEELGSSAVATLPGGACFTRKVVQRSAYTVEPTEYVDMRHVKKPSKEIQKLIEAAADADPVDAGSIPDEY